MTNEFQRKIIASLALAGNSLSRKAIVLLHMPAELLHKVRLQYNDTHFDKPAKTFASRKEAICLEWFNLLGRKAALGPLWDLHLRVYRKRDTFLLICRLFDSTVQKDMPVTILITTGKYKKVSEQTNCRLSHLRLNSSLHTSSVLSQLQLH